MWIHSDMDDTLMGSTQQSLPPFQERGDSLIDTIGGGGHCYVDPIDETEIKYGCCDKTLIPFLVLQ